MPPLDYVGNTLIWGPSSKSCSWYWVTAEGRECPEGSRKQVLFLGKPANQITLLWRPQVVNVVWRPQLHQDVEKDTFPVHCSYFPLSVPSSGGAHTAGSSSPRSRSWRPSGSLLSRTQTLQRTAPRDKFSAPELETFPKGHTPNRTPTQREKAAGKQYYLIVELFGRERRNRSENTVSCF